MDPLSGSFKALGTLLVTVHFLLENAGFGGLLGALLLNLFEIRLHVADLGPEGRGLF